MTEEVSFISDVKIYTLYVCFPTIAFQANVRQHVFDLLTSPSTIHVRYAPSMEDQAPPIVTRREIGNARGLCPHRLQNTGDQRIYDFEIGSYKSPWEKHRLHSIN
jgi:hypothetical protein